MKRILILISALFLFALGGNAQNPSKSALEVLDGRNYKLLIDREIRNNWGKVSDSFSVGLVHDPAEFSKQPKVAINSEEVPVSDHWIIINGEKITCRIGDILEYQLAGDKDVNKKYRKDVKDNGEILELDITEYKETAKRSKRLIEIISYHKTGVYCAFKISITNKGKAMIRLYDKAGNQIREYKGVLDMDYGQ